ncbi:MULTISPECIES: hypothetical protein, partial [unclassified Citrobacter]|uniref:hypothetical protein n=1 Tax=unclassified Citrobacter TaxID=2644389 RepID=UPI00227C6992
GLTALSAEFTIGEGELMAHDVPLGCAPDEYDDLISGTCSHLPLQHKDFSLPDYGISPGNLRGIPESNRVHNYHSPDEHPLHIISGKSGKRDISCQPLITQGFFTCRFQ